MRTLCGHDKNQFYIVLETDNSFAYLVNGKNKTLLKPKKKKLKHIEVTELFAELSKYSPLYDAHILKELKSLLK